ncbi:Tll0287-like domain-containing protein [Piscinibacter defluvii]|uniref:Tll0287-like domain-containing protein n=1 Tax=Piscinibacter defluvii TaxID=1796922 RepID=UPI000FDDFE29|nr:DUF3365 domain-containing protein [Piscinibacter defluvii]
MKPHALPVMLAMLCLPAAAQDAWVDEARRVAASVPPKLAAVLTAEIERGGPAHAIGVCREEAPTLARAASQESGWSVRRVSLRERNPKAVPDDWERAALEDFDRRAAAGEKPATLERAEIVQQPGGAVMRYMRALPVAELCTTCHGSAERIPAEVRARLAELYPQDRATGYAVGQIRGAMTISKPLR